MKQARMVILVVIALVLGAGLLWKMGSFTPGPSVSGKKPKTFDPALEEEFQEWMGAKSDANDTTGGDGAPSDANVADANKPADVAEPNKPAEANEPNSVGEPNEPGEPMEALNLKDVEMKDIIQRLAQWTGKVIIPHDEAMKQKLTIYSAEKLPRSQALALLYSALRAKGFVAEHSDGVVFLKPIAEARLGSVPTVPDNQPLASIEDKNRIVQKFFRLKNYNPAQMGDIILPLVGEYGYVGADETTGNLMVVDNVENLIRIEKIVQEFDVPESEQQASEIFQIKNGDPAEIVQLLRILLAEDSRSRGRSSGSSTRGPGGGTSRAPGSGGGEAKSVVLTSGRTQTILIADTKRMCIIAKGSAEAIEEIRVWIEKLDTGEQIESDYETVQITYADPREVATEIDRTLRQMPGQELTPSATVRALPQSRQIMIVGRADMRDMVKKIIQEVDIPTGEFETRVFKLKSADPDQIKENLEGLYETQSGYTYSYGYSSRRSRTVSPADTVKVISFPTMSQVTVIASAENMLKIAAQIEEWDVPIDVEKVKPRIITLHNSDPVQMADLLTTLFSEQSENLSFWDRYYGAGEDKQKIVGPLYGQLTFEAVPDTKKIIVISNIAEAYDVIEDLIRELDSQEMAEVPRVITLKYADVEDLAERLNAIFNEAGTNAPIRYRQTGLTEYSMQTSDSSSGSSGGGNQNQSSGQSTSTGTYQPPWTRARTTTDEMPLSNVIGRVRFIPDPRTKSILVLAPPEFQPNIEKMIQDLDVPGKQVMVKAVVVEVDHRDLSSLGVQLSSDRFAFDPIGENAVTALTQLSTLYERGSFTLAANMDVTTLVDFLHRRLDAKILNEQTLWTEDNEEALFFKGDKVGFIENVSVSGSGDRVTSGISFQDVGMTLQVRPSITPESRVDMLVRIEISQLKNEIINGQPVRARMETKTNMIVENGQTIMLGGILFQTQSTTERKIPLFGDIPLVGGLFRHNDIAESNNEMIVFITPYVVDSPENTLPETKQMLENAEKKLNVIRGELNAAVGDPNTEPLKQTIKVDGR